MARRRQGMNPLGANEALRRITSGTRSGIKGVTPKGSSPPGPAFPSEHLAFMSGSPKLPMARYGLRVEGIEERMAAEKRDKLLLEENAKRSREARERDEAARIEHTKHMDFADARAAFLKQHEAKNAEVRIQEPMLNLMLNWVEEKKGVVRAELAKELRKKKNRSEYIGRVALNEAEFKRIIAETLAQKHNIPFKAGVAFANWYVWARKLPKAR